MMRTPVSLSALLLLPALAACGQDNGFAKVTDYGGVYESSITGRVCDATRNVWLEGATVYTHIIVDNELVGTAEAVTNADGWFQLAELRNDTTYTVYVQYGSSVIDQYDVDIEGSQDVELPEPECSTALASAVAVVSGDYDEVNAVLARFGITDTFQVNGQTGTDLVHFLASADNLAQYEAVVFAGGHIEEDVLYDTDGSDVDGDVASVLEAIRTYVQGGGTVWATDWSYDLVEAIWPSAVEWVGDDSNPNDAQLGEPDAADATVRDRELADAIGTSAVRVQFDLDTWPVAQSVGDGVTIYETVDAPWRFGMESGTQADAPVALEFGDGKGHVVYTSWTLDANAGDGEAVIRYLLDRL